MTTQSKRDPLTVEMKNFGFEWDYHNHRAKLTVGDVKVGGLTLPQLGWGWIGMAVAETVVSNLIGMAFNALVEAVFGKSGKSIGELLEEQLEAIANIVEQKLDERELKNCISDVKSFVQLFQEYSRAPSHGRFDYLINESSRTLSRLEDLQFLGYRTYMACAGLRLAVLKEAVSISKAEGPSFIAQREYSIKHHVAMTNFIDQQTSVLELVKRFHFRADCFAGFREPAMIHQGQINVLGKLFDGWFVTTLNGDREIVEPPYAPLKAGFIDFSKPRLLGANIRQSLHAENTDQGSLIVQRWEKLQP